MSESRKLGDYLNLKWIPLLFTPTRKIWKLFAVQVWTNVLMDGIVTPPFRVTNANVLNTLPGTPSCGAMFPIRDYLVNEISMS